MSSEPFFFFDKIQPVFTPRVILEKIMRQQKRF